MADCSMLYSSAIFRAAGLNAACAPLCTRCMGAAAAAGLAVDDRGRGCARGGAELTPTPSPIVPSTLPTAVAMPAGTRISDSTPALGAGTSTVTSSVSSSTSGSSIATASPGFLSHLATVASVTDSPRAGTRISMAIVFALQSFIEQGAARAPICDDFTWRPGPTHHQGDSSVPPDGDSFVPRPVMQPQVARHSARAPSSNRHGSAPTRDLAP